MGNRKLPFGYQMRMGEIVWNEPEAKAVQDIFLQYTFGASLKEIARTDEQRLAPPTTRQELEQEHDRTESWKAPSTPGAERLSKIKLT